MHFNINRSLEHPDVDADSCMAVENNSLLNVELNSDCILQHSVNEIEMNFQYLESLGCEVLPSNLFNKETISSINKYSQNEVCSQKQQTHEQETSAAPPFACTKYCWMIMQKLLLSIKGV